MSFRCRTCSELHEGLPDVGFAKPDPWFDVPTDERERRTRLTSDSCVIDEETFFIRGVLHLPLTGTTERSTFGLGVWVSQSRASFARYLEESETVIVAPSFGWLSTRVPCYDATTFALETTVHFTGPKTRPSIVLHPSEHRAFHDQRDGVTLEHAWEMVHGCTT